ncbi:Hpt domain-containing protein [Pseudodesulfovibrio sp. F-1]|uniref:Hpt domain-containing protein n=1 Tax=Pseudodesulfovibrio alkaliphilus TaxID=2661613 RepID=A0A7K1KM31_9BACT|nr:Hpt domain-containing protein [Pseudodesulfovibrio alkaliphilus]MUM76942.1 Hpt domain-containing protein [Pseudodesulfovibrio alkaliphilus]
MTEPPIIERIDADLEELMERFFASSRREVEAMRAALAAQDFVTLARLGHTAKGTGYGYGFRGMGDIGLALESAALADDHTGAASQVERLAHYLASVRVEFVD